MSSLLNILGLSSSSPAKTEKKPERVSEFSARKALENVPMTSSQKTVGECARKYISSDIADWIEEKDKYCTDHYDDGKISLKEKASNFAKGFFGGVVKEVIKHPVATLVTVGIGAAVVAATGGAALPAMVALGATVSTATIGYGAYKSVTAKTDKEEKEAYEAMGTGVFGLLTSALSAKKALSRAVNAGVTSAEQAKDAGMVESLVRCFKSTPEALRVSGQNIVKTAKAIVSTAKIVASNLNVKTMTTAESLENEKNIMRYRVEKSIRQSRNLSVNSARSQDKVLQENLLKSVNEDNIDLAKQLIYDHGESGMYSSNYVVEREAYSEYVLKSVPKVLQSTDPKVHEAAKYIIGCKDIPDKFHAIKVLNSSNAQEIMNIKPQIIRGEYYSVQELLWKNYPMKYKQPRVLPFMEINEGGLLGKTRNSNHIRIFGEKGKIPKVPGAHPLIDPKTKLPDYNHYVIYEETAERIRFWDAMDKANALIDKYGYQ